MSFFLLVLFPVSHSDLHPRWNSALVPDACFWREHPENAYHSPHSRKEGIFSLPLGLAQSFFCSEEARVPWAGQMMPDQPASAGHLSYRWPDLAVLQNWAQ